MFSKRYFGPPPGKSLLVALGLRFPAEVYTDAGKWYWHARTVLEAWHAKGPAGHCRISEQVCQVPACSSRPEQAGLLLSEAYRAGLRVWLDGVLGSEVPIKSPDDLRLWSTLQLTAIRHCKEAYPIHLCKGPQQLYDADLLRMFGVLLLGCVRKVSPKQGQQLGEQLGRLRCHRLGEEDRTCSSHSCRLSEAAGIPVPEQPKPEEFQRLVSQTWDYLRAVGHLTKQITSPGPPEVHNAAGCVQALYWVIVWCGEKADAPDRTEEGQRLTDTPREILTALLWLNATSYERRETTTKIAETAAGKLATPESFKKPIAQLARDGYVATHSGRRGGVWLTEKGRAKAEEITRSDPA
jgi:hypothetical protein